MNYQDPKLKDIAKNHIKMFERVSINPGRYIVNGNEYFLAIYKKKRIKGYAVISPQQEKRAFVNHTKI